MSFLGVALVVTSVAFAAAAIYKSPTLKGLRVARAKRNHDAESLKQAREAFRSRFLDLPKALAAHADLWKAASSFRFDGDQPASPTSTELRELGIARESLERAMELLDSVDRRHAEAFLSKLRAMPSPPGSDALHAFEDGWAPWARQMMADYRSVAQLAHLPEGLSTRFLYDPSLRAEVAALLQA